MKNLVIVESPTKAHKIQEYLGEEYIVMSSKGHITDLAKVGKNNFGVDIENNFKPKYVLMEDKLDVIDKLITAAKNCKEILIFSDNDREGSSIAWHLRERLKDVGKPIRRGIFNELKKEILIKAVKEAGDIDMNLFYAAEARRILDRLVGFSASPFLMNFFGPKLSSGRVQSPVVRMVVDREAEIDNFTPEDYWTIQVNLSKDNKESFTTKYSGKLSNSTDAEIMRDKLADKNNQFLIKEVLAAEEKTGAPAPMITSSLQRLMSKNHSISSDRTMKAAQNLYESGYCTYIRTDSTRTGDEALKEVREWLQNNNHPLPKKSNFFKNKNSAQDAHECIRPTDINLLPSNFSGGQDEQLVYQTIWNYFVASQMTPTVYNTLKITACVKGKPEAEVKTSGKAMKDPGFFAILGMPTDSKIDIPNLNKGDICQLFGKIPVKMEKKQTQPPPRYSEDKLLKELEIRGIGRPATYSSLLSTITSRNYVEKKGNIYYPTELGKKITNVLTNCFTFMNYNYTAELEEKLDKIAEGTLDRTDMLKNFYPAFKKELDAAYKDQGSDICEKCGSAMVIRINKQNKDKFLGCSSWPNCKNAKPITNN